MESFLQNNAELVNTITEMVVKYGTKVVMAIVVLIVGFWLIARITKIFNTTLGKKGFDESLQIYLGKMLGLLLKFGLIISIASMVGIETTSFVAIFGAAGLAVGLALQGSLSNFAGGVLILFFRPFKVGDFIQAQGEEGVVSAIDVFFTTVTTVDNRRVLLPNGPLAGEKMVNVGAEPTRRVDLSVGIGYGDDFNKACEVICKMAQEDSRILTNPEPPFVGITGFGDSAVDLTVRVWCKSSEYWPVFFDTNKRLKECLDKSGINIPFPQRDVHLHNVK